jgi:hypothetical protein
MKVYLDDERPTPDGWVRAYTVDEAIKLLETNQVTHISLDNDLGRDEAGNDRPIGRLVADYIERPVASEGFVPPEVTAHSMNPVERARMNVIIDNIQRYHLKNLGE